MSEPIAWPSEPPTELSGPLPPPPPEEHRRPVASIWTRAGGFALDLVLIACTFGFGWVGWWIIAWSDGQSPAKLVLHLHVVNEGDGRLASFGQMAVREAAGKAVAAVAALVGLYFGLWWLVGLAVLYVASSVMLALTDNRRRTLWDRLAKTVVLEGDPPPWVATPPTEASTALV
jgi:uncharacterized RDD family membrane protein YckC